MSLDVRDFGKQVLERSRTVPVLVDFWAPWCGPCRSLGPVLEALAAEAAGRWELVKVNTDENPELAMAFNISSIPAVKLFVNGEVVDEFVGALSKSEVRRWLERALPSPTAGQLDQAQALLDQGQAAEAARLLEPIVAAEPANHRARVLLARAVLGTAPERVAELLQPVGEDSDQAVLAAALRTLARVASLAGQPDALPAGPGRDRYLVGAQAVRRGDWETALPAFIEVLERHKTYDDGGAKEACRAIFQLLGPRHPVSERYFRAYSSALHA